MDLSNDSVLLTEVQLEIKMITPNIIREQTTALRKQTAMTITIAFSSKRY